MANEIFEFRNGICTRFNGNYSDYAEKAKEMYADEAPKPKKENTKKERVFVGKKKLRFSFKEQREFETIDDDIASLEEQIAAAEKDIAANSSDYVKLQELSDKKEQLENELAEKMERWVYLNDLAERIERGETE
ncbi:hypothetical protein [Ruminococcus flavefaciens]